MASRSLAVRPRCLGCARGCRYLDLARERQAHEAGARTRATAHERTPQQERQKAAREAERGREAWTLGQGMKKPVAGCYGRLTRWKGGGDVVYMALL